MSNFADAIERQAEALSLAGEAHRVRFLEEWQKYFGLEHNPGAVIVGQTLGVIQSPKETWWIINQKGTWGRDNTISFINKFLVRLAPASLLVVEYYRREVIQHTANKTAIPDPETIARNFLDTQHGEYIIAGVNGKKINFDNIKAHPEKFIAYASDDIRKFQLFVETLGLRTDYLV